MLWFWVRFNLQFDLIEELMRLNLQCLGLEGIRLEGIRLEGIRLEGICSLLQFDLVALEFRFTKIPLAACIQL